MKITRVETLIANALMHNQAFVRMETDQPGICGQGEASLELRSCDLVDVKSEMKCRYLLSPEESGLGVDINEAEARKHPYQEEILERIVIRDDRSVEDW